MLPQPHVKLHSPDYINKFYSSFCMLGLRITVLKVLLNSHCKDTVLLTETLMLLYSR